MALGGTLALAAVALCACSSHEGWDAANACSALGAQAEPARWKKATKQLATLGPASSSVEMIERLFLARPSEAKDICSRF